MFAGKVVPKADRIVLYAPDTQAFYAAVMSFYDYCLASSDVANVRMFPPAEIFRVYVENYARTYNLASNYSFHDTCGVALPRFTPNKVKDVLDSAMPKFVVSCIRALCRPMVTPEGYLIVPTPLLFTEMHDYNPQWRVRNQRRLGRPSPELQRFGISFFRNLGAAFSTAFKGTPMIEGVSTEYLSPRKVSYHVFCQPKNRTTDDQNVEPEEDDENKARTDESTGSTDDDSTKKKEKSTFSLFDDDDDEEDSTSEKKTVKKPGFLASLVSRSRKFKSNISEALWRKQFRREESTSLRSSDFEALIRRRMPHEIADPLPDPDDDDEFGRLVEAPDKPTYFLNDFHVEEEDDLNLEANLIRPLVVRMQGDILRDPYGCEQYPVDIAFHGIMYSDVLSAPYDVLRWSQNVVTRLEENYDPTSWDTVWNTLTAHWHTMHEVTFPGDKALVASESTTETVKRKRKKAKKSKPATQVERKAPYEHGSEKKKE